MFSNKDANDAAQAQINAYTTGLGDLTNTIQGQAIPALNTNYGNANTALQGNYTSALQPFQTNQNTANQGVNQFAALLGLGPNGGAGIQNTLQNLPGYQFALNQGAQNVLRNQAQAGQLNSGATDLALQQQGQGLASQNYNNYLSQLQPFLQYSTAGAQGIGNIYTGLGSGLSSNDVNLGNATSGAYTGLGQAQYGADVGKGNAQAQADYANLQNSSNFWNMLGNVAGGGLKLAGGNPNVGSNIASNVKGLFSGFGNG